MKTSVGVHAWFYHHRDQSVFSSSSKQLLSEEEEEEEEEGVYSESYKEIRGNLSEALSVYTYTSEDKEKMSTTSKAEESNTAQYISSVEGIAESNNENKDTNIKSDSNANYYQTEIKENDRRQSSSVSSSLKSSPLFIDANAYRSADDPLFSDLDSTSHNTSLSHPITSPISSGSLSLFV
jgi:uncharacterized protein with LGFP repeats